MGSYRLHDTESHLRLTYPGDAHREFSVRRFQSLNFGTTFDVPDINVTALASGSY